MLDKGAITAAAISEGAATESGKSYERLLQKTDTIAEMRLKFFDQVVLLDGWTVALSVTLISSFVAKGNYGVKYVSVLAVAWIAFVLSMLFALTRNWIEHDRLGKAVSTNYLVAVQYSTKTFKNFGNAISGPSDAEAAIQKTIDEGSALFKTERKKLKSLLFKTKVAGILSLICTLLGFALLLFFAIRNMLYVLTQPFTK
jgi:hypothetical protein